MIRLISSYHHVASNRARIAQRLLDSRSRQRPSEGTNRVGTLYRAPGKCNEFAYAREKNAPLESRMVIYIMWEAVRRSTHRLISIASRSQRVYANARGPKCPARVVTCLIHSRLERVSGQVRAVRTAFTQGKWPHRLN